MRAVQIAEYGGPEVLDLVEVDTPSPGEGQVLVEVHGSSVNPVDIALRNGWMAEAVPLSLPATLGMDVAGVVAALGDGVSGLSVGDPVFGVAGIPNGGSGGFAEFAVTGADCLARPPANIDLATAGTLGWVGQVALQAMESLGVQSGTRLLVHGASGGVGQLAVAIAKHLGAYVVASAHGAGVEVASGLGADEVVDTDETDLASLEPFERTLDLVCQDPLLPITVTRPGGMVVALLMPADQAAADEKGVTTILQWTQASTARLDGVRELVEQGVLKPHVVDFFPVEEITSAFRRKEGGGVYGKIGVTIR